MRTGASVGAILILLPIIFLATIWKEVLIILGVVALWFIGKYVLKKYYIYKISQYIQVDIASLGKILDARIVEDQKINKDSYEYEENIIKWTWKYIRKDGKPDLRYKNNNMIPLHTTGIIRIHLEKYKKICTVTYNIAESAMILRNQLFFKDITINDMK